MNLTHNSTGAPEVDHLEVQRELLRVGAGERGLHIGDVPGDEGVEVADPAAEPVGMLFEAGWAAAMFAGTEPGVVSGRSSSLPPFRRSPRGCRLPRSRRSRTRPADRR